MKKMLLAAVAAVSMLGAAGAASADTYLLNLTTAQSALPAPYGKVDITDISGGVSLVLTLFDGLKLTDTGTHYAFTFSLTNTANPVTLSAVNGVSNATGWSLAKAVDGIDNSPFGGFDYGIACTAAVCGPNLPGTATPITFTLLGSSVNAAAFKAVSTTTFNGQSVLFAADTTTSGLAQNVTGTIGGGIAVPEPATWALMIGGFGAAGAMLRRRRTAFAA